MDSKCAVCGLGRRLNPLCISSFRGIYVIGFPHRDLPHPLRRIPPRDPRPRESLFSPSSRTSTLPLRACLRTCLRKRMRKFPRVRSCAQVMVCANVCVYIHELEISNFRCDPIEGHIIRVSDQSSVSYSESSVVESYIFYSSIIECIQKKKKC